MTARPHKIHRILRLAMIAIYAAAILSITIRSGSPSDPSWWLLEIPFLLWIVAPIATPLLLRLDSWLLTGGVAVMAAYSLYVYERDMFGPGARSTSALIFIFLPAYLWVGTAILITLAYGVQRAMSK